MLKNPFKTITLLFSFLLIFSTANPSFSQTDYQRWLRMAENARKSGQYDTALTYYQRAADASPDGPNDPDINTAITEVLAERLASVEQRNPNYGRYIRIADEAYSNGEYDTAIINYRRALKERPQDRYANIRIQQSECIKKYRPATGAQFRTFGCPSF
ncbi:MAG TPA: tetratricopeptide repeat protein [Leptolyngbyaceae cyanobacterium]